MSKAPFTITAALLAIAIAYRNAKLIADEVLPRVFVGKKEFKYLKQTLAESFTIPQTKVGRKSAPNQVDFTASEVTSATEDFGLDDSIPYEDIENAPENYDPKGRAVEGITDLVLLDREVRTAALVFAAGTYTAKTDLSGQGKYQWDDFEHSTPIKDIMTGLDALIIRPNIMVIGRSAFSQLSQHPHILKAVHANSGDTGVANRQAIAALFELEEILVGEGWANTAKKGQTASLARVWGGHASLIYRNKLADTQRGITFGLTAQFGSKIAGEQTDLDIGLKGGVRVRSGESVKELVTASDVGYFIQNAV